MRNRYAALVWLCLIPFLLSACTEHYKTDYIRKFDDYLDYSLGDYKVVEKEQVEWRADPLPLRGTGYRWVLAFTDDRGMERKFGFLNYGYTKGGDAANFGYAVRDYAAELGQEQIVSEILLAHFQPEEVGWDAYKTNSSHLSVAVLDEYISHDSEYYARFVDRKKGISLKSVTPEQLVNDWDILYEIEFFTSLEDEVQRKQLIAKAEDVLRDYAKYVNNYDLLPVEINGEETSDGYYGTYDRETDTFTWITMAEYLESLRYIDGHLKEVGKVIVNGKEYVVRKVYKDVAFTGFANNVSYSAATGEYHVDGFEHILTLLGYEVSFLGKGTYEWKSGADTYRVRKYGDWTLKKNGGDNLLQYSAYENGGLSQSDLEMVSNATVYMDEEREALIVTGK